MTVKKQKCDTDILKETYEMNELEIVSNFYKFRLFPSKGKYYSHVAAVYITKFASLSMMCNNGESASDAIGQITLER